METLSITYIKNVGNTYHSKNTCILIKNDTSSLIQGKWTSDFVSIKSCALIPLSRAPIIEPKTITCGL